MKVFVYSKKTNETLAMIKKAIKVLYDEPTKTIHIITDQSEQRFDAKVVKTRIYQN